MTHRILDTRQNELVIAGHINVDVKHLAAVKAVRRALHVLILHIVEPAAVFGHKIAGVNIPLRCSGFRQVNGTLLIILRIGKFVGRNRDVAQRNRAQTDYCRGPKRQQPVLYALSHDVEYSSSHTSHLIRQCSRICRPLFSRCIAGCLSPNGTAASLRLSRSLRTHSERTAQLRPSGCAAARHGGRILTTDRE